MSKSLDEVSLLPRNAMFQVTREIDFCYGHRLLGYQGKCRYLHGHNGRALITVAASELDEQGMVLDFTEIKRTISAWIDNHLDHRMLLDQKDPVVPLLQGAGEPLLLINVSPTAENIARLICQVAADQGYPVVEVRLWETPRCFATYRPSQSDQQRIEWRLWSPSSPG